MNTLALNMIVAAGEAEILQRCLTSFHANEVFDQIVIVNTASDTEIDKVANLANATLCQFDWCSVKHPYGNFAGARNCALDASTTDYVMWLDTDDVLNPVQFESWRKMVTTIKDSRNNHVKLYTLPYTLICDNQGNSVTAFTRERVFKRTEGRWVNPVHELILPVGGAPAWPGEHTANFNGLSIIHAPIKPQYTSAVRNIKILEHEYNVNKSTDINIKYFLARDYLLAGRVAEGEAIFIDIVEHMETSYEMLYAIAIDMVWYYGYGKLATRPCLRDINIKNTKQIEKWLRIALGFSTNSAEPFVLLGDLYFIRAEYKSAEKMYMLAMKKDTNKPKMQAFLYYKEIPLWRLSMLYYHIGEYEKALYTTKNWMPVTQSKANCLKIRNDILGILQKQYAREEVAA